MSIFGLLMAEGEAVVTDVAQRVSSNGNFSAFLGAALAVVLAGFGSSIGVGRAGRLPPGF